MHNNYRYKKTKYMKSFFKISIIFICLTLCYLYSCNLQDVLKLKNLCNFNLTVGEGIKYQPFESTNQGGNGQNIYVVDEYNGENIETNINDNNYYMIVSNKKISDEQAMEMTEELDKTAQLMQERMYNTINEMIVIQKMIKEIFEY